MYIHIYVCSMHFLSSFLTRIALAQASNNVVGCTKRYIHPIDFPGQPYGEAKAAEPIIHLIVSYKMPQKCRNANAIQNGKPGFPIYLKGFRLPFHCNRLPGVKQVKPSTSDSLYDAIFLLLGTVPSVASDARLPPRLPLPLALLPVPVAAPSIPSPNSPSPFFPDSLNAPT